MFSDSPGKSSSDKRITKNEKTRIIPEFSTSAVGGGLDFRIFL